MFQKMLQGGSSSKEIGEIFSYVRANFNGITVSVDWNKYDEVYTFLRSNEDNNYFLLKIDKQGTVTEISSTSSFHNLYFKYMSPTKTSGGVSFSGTNTFGAKVGATVIVTKNTDLTVTTVSM